MKIKLNLLLITAWFVSRAMVYPNRKGSNLTEQNYVNSMENFKYWLGLPLNLSTKRKAKETMKVIFFLL